MSYKGLLAVLDLADGDDAVVERAVNLAKVHGAEVKLEHVLEPIASIPLDDHKELLSELEPHLIEAVERMEPIRRKYPEYINQENGVGAGYGLRRQLINAVAKDKNCDLIVVGDHGRHSQELVSPAPDATTDDAPLDVLLVRTQKKA
ncbi:universal stress protein [Streptomyces sp. NPDC056323]|uniref:universal stress protein n=1 Tax=Streptomyces sp. NPDC056323 TaxID=3345784 RepID=UPI0035DDD445